MIRRLDAQLQHVPDRVVLDIWDSSKRLIDACFFDHPDDRHLEPVVRPEYLDAAVDLLRADLRAVITEELTKPSPSVGIERRAPSGRDHLAEIAHCPKPVEKEAVLP